MFSCDLPSGPRSLVVKFNINYLDLHTNHGHPLVGNTSSLLCDAFGCLLCNFLENFLRRSLYNFLRSHFSLELLPVGPSTRARQNFHIVFDVRHGRRAADRFADHIQRGILHLREADAASAHIQFLSRLRPRLLEPRALRLVAVNAHEVNRHVALLARKRRHHQRLARIAVITERPHAVRHGVTDHSPEHGFLVILVEIRANHFAQHLDPLAAIMKLRWLPSDGSPVVQLVPMSVEGQLTVTAWGVC